MDISKLKTILVHLYKRSAIAYELVIDIDQDQNGKIYIEIKNAACNETCVYMSIINHILRIIDLGKCQSSGTEHLKTIIEFAKDIKVEKITLQDASALQFKFKDAAVMIDLHNLYILATGKSWYEKMGFFYDDRTDERTAKIQAFIEQRLKHYERLASKVFKLIRQDATTFQTITIQEFFSKLHRFIRRNCTSDGTCIGITHAEMRLISECVDAMFQQIQIYPTGAMTMELP